MKLIFKSLSLFLVYLLFSFSSIAQGIEGKIIDQNKNPLPYVNIHKMNTSLGVATNLDGLYSLNLPAGKHIVEYRMIGFKTITDTIYVREGKKTRKKLHSFGGKC